MRGDLISERRRRFVPFLDDATAIIYPDKLGTSFGQESSTRINN
eukprot:COSAG06_NODE_4027_length_4645_cov_2.647602_2_plen_44_part_00